MRIAVALFEFPSLSETFALNQITGLLERGHHVDIYSLSGRPGNSSTMHPDVDKYHLLEHTIYAPRIPDSYCKRVLRAIQLIVTYGRRVPGPVWRSLNVWSHGRQAASLSLLATVIAFHERRPAYDIILNQFGTVGLLTIPLRHFGLTSGKSVTFFRGSDVSEYVRRRGQGVYADLFQQGDLFLTNCEFFRQRLLEMGCDKSKVAVHGSGIDCDRFSYRSPQVPGHDTWRIATTGRLVEKKGMEYGIRAVAKLLQAGRRVEYHIIGDGPLRPKLEALARELGIVQWITFHGARSQESMVGILRRAQVFLAPCVTASNGDQDAPVNSLKEAMALGIPVIGTQHGGIPELIEDGVSGLLVPERDSAAIADRISELMDRPDRLPEMTRSARQFVERHYDNDRLNELLVERFQCLLAGRSTENDVGAHESQNPVCVSHAQ